jgi:hypothetical protein
MKSRHSTIAAFTTFVLMFAFGFAGSYAVVKQKSQSATTVADTVELTVDTTVADSTIPLGLDSTLADTTVADTTEAPPETIASTAPKPTVPAARGEPPVSTDGAILSAPDSPEPRQLNPDDTCNSLARTGSSDLCDTVTLGDAKFAWVFEGGGEGVDLLAGDADLADVYTVQLRATALPAQAPRVVDVTGDGQPELVLGWRGEDGLLNVDIVEARGRSLVVTLHVELVDGRVSAGGGSLDVWNGVPQPGDDPSNPSSFDRWTYEKRSGRWVATAERDDNPPSGQI